MSEADQFAYEIAVVGLAGRFPGARNHDEFWRRLCEGAELVSFFSDEELSRRGADPAALKDPHYVKAEAVLEDIELFDASFFWLHSARSGNTRSTTSPVSGRIMDGPRECRLQLPDLRRSHRRLRW